MNFAKEFGIRIASNPDQRQRARILVERMYGWRGYTLSKELDLRNCIIHNVVEEGEVIGTATLCLDSTSGLFADEVFHDYMTEIRNDDTSLCEICRLAFKISNASKTTLGALFHVMFIYAYRLNNRTHAVIQVNPRHKTFYEKMLGFTTLSEMRVNKHTNAPAYLLCLDLKAMADGIRQWGGTASQNGRTESLYPYFFTPIVEDGILRRLATSASKEDVSDMT